MGGVRPRGRGQVRGIAAREGSYRSEARAMRARMLVLLAPAPPGGCEWHTDFKQQHVINPRASPDTLTTTRANPQGSVTTSGSRVSGLEGSYSPMPLTVDSMSGLSKPTPSSAASLPNGRIY